MSDLRANDVFAPSSYPTHTYVERDEEPLERRLRDALETPGEVVSLSGPSKSGKTVLIERVVGLDELIAVTGAGIKSAEDLWDRVLDWMGSPHDVTNHDSTSHSGSLTVEAGGQAGLPGLAKAKVSGTGALTSGRATGVSRSSKRRGLAQIVEEIADSDYVLLIDDFHYMRRNIQSEVAKEIKEAARQGVKICTASVPHRADDVVRSNPELRGRVRAIDLDYWKPDQLTRIAAMGFPLLNITVDTSAIDSFSIEASGSPQLMQAICLQCCFVLEVRVKRSEPEALQIVASDMERILEETSTRTDFTSLVTKLHRGPKTRGTERKEFPLIDGTHGDVYRCILTALASNPPRLSFPYNELSRRIGAVCNDDVPQAASVYQACSQIHRMTEEMYPEERVLDWDETDSILEVVDPYLLFYLRWSGRLRTLGED